MVIHITVKQSELDEMEVDQDGLVEMFYTSDLDDDLSGYNIIVSVIND